MIFYVAVGILEFAWVCFDLSRISCYCSDHFLTDTLPYSAKPFAAIGILHGIITIYNLIFYIIFTITLFI